MSPDHDFILNEDYGGPMGYATPLYEPLASLPFASTKLSGYGRELGLPTSKEFMNHKVINGARGRRAGLSIRDHRIIKRRTLAMDVTDEESLRADVKHSNWPVRPGQRSSRTRRSCSRSPAHWSR